MSESFFHNIRVFFNPLFSHKSLAGVVILRSLYFSFSWVFFTYLVKLSIDSISNGDSKQFLDALFLLVILFVCDIFPNHTMRKMHKKFLLSFQNSLYGIYLSKYFQLDNNLIDQKGTGYFVNVIGKGITNWSQLLHSFCERGVHVLAKLIFALIVITFYTGIVWFIISFLLVVVSIMIAQYGNVKSRSLRIDRREIYTSIDRSLIKMIMSKFEILSQGKAVFELEKFSIFFSKLYNVMSKESYLRIFAFDIQQGLIKWLQIGLIAYVWYNVLQGHQEIWVIALIWMLCNQINSAIDSGNNFILDYYDRIIYVQKLWDVFAEKLLISWYNIGENFLYKWDDIILDSITYAYNDKKVFDKFSLVIAGGKKTAFVGVSGVWKSTLVKLIAWYIQPSEGCLKIGGQNLPIRWGYDEKQISLLSYYQSIGYLSQEPNVFDGTVYENLIYALEVEPTEEEIQKVLFDAQCGFVWDLPNGIHTQIGEKGIRLSWWQRQRLAIAKIMLKNPPIIILDEPTSALDSFSEEAVTQAFTTLTVGRTVIIVAHRLQTVKNADEIVVLENGRVVESGTHDQLLAENGVYASMLELQSWF